jgi:periplasmic divalent cation tolerance protein
VTEEVCEILITAPDADWLASFVHGLIQQRLCAAGHIDEIRSIYRWQGEVEDKPEARVRLHTRSSLVPTIIDQTAEKHPYVVPCVIATPIATASPAYRQWILDETQEQIEGERP